ncbi:class I SAM-dependent methyltransferase [Anaeromyxobacter sp. SG26]|uniref:class I SAM-dependent methyltransferase n=1 Tax=Anaeromyxobacter sp. SG26 TaxID=2925407 RepID=UPI001F57EF2C|nr:class I SAM-dependent methyltransferase [Anaeromyxobacter sp. SG26]
MRSADPRLESPRDRKGDYADRLVGLQQAWWKRLLEVQRPYREHLRRLNLGFVLEVGCGIGRNLAHLGPGAAVGVDVDARAVEIARARRLVAFTPEELDASAFAVAGRFDALLLSHVLEHLHLGDAEALVRRYLPLLRADARVVAITPQEAGFRSDPTHVEFMDFTRVATVLEGAGLELSERYSFPFPRAVGRVFKYNEFVCIARKHR